MVVWGTERLMLHSVSFSMIKIEENGLSGNGRLWSRRLSPVALVPPVCPLPSAHHITVPVLWVAGQHVHIQNHYHHFARNGLAILALSLALLTWIFFFALFIINRCLTQATLTWGQAVRKDVELISSQRKAANSPGRWSSKHEVEIVLNVLMDVKDKHFLKCHFLTTILGF